MSAVNRPRLLVVLAVTGLVLGGFGTMSATSTATSMLATRDEFVGLAREQAEKLLPPEKREEVGNLWAKCADAVYSRRLTVLPLAAMHLVLSFLLFVGCARALRGQAWGLSAWQVAALGNLPYHLLATVYALVLDRELTMALGAGLPLDPLSRALFAVDPSVAVWKAVVLGVYFAGCLLYLRRPDLRRLFDSTPTA